WADQKIETPDNSGDSPAAVYGPWFAWFEKHYPTEAQKLSGFAAAEGQAWRDRLAGVDWGAGVSERGKRTVEKMSCHRCHRGAGKLGPDLAGAADRFSIEDLFAAIIDPERDIAPLYRTTAVTTRSGHTYQGLLVYESSDGLLIQTDADTTVRVAGDDVANT